MERQSGFVKEWVCIAAGAISGAVSQLVGGFDLPVTALMICMGVDYLTGLIVAGVFHSSPKTAGGGLDSRVGWKGLARKMVTVMIVVVANLADMLTGQCCIRDAVVIGFCVNECISILENAGCMGIRIPKALVNALERLREQEEDDGTETA